MYLQDRDREILYHVYVFEIPITFDKTRDLQCENATTNLGFIMCLVIIVLS